jgi:hypothetical protein
VDNADCGGVKLNTVLSSSRGEASAFDGLDVNFGEGIVIGAVEMLSVRMSLRLRFGGDANGLGGSAAGVVGSEDWPFLLNQMPKGSDVILSRPGRFVRFKVGGSAETGEGIGDMLVKSCFVLRLGCETVG